MNKSFLIFVLSLCIISSYTAKNLIMVQQLFRHGARYPIYANSKDGSQYALKDHAQGQLTTQGKKMHYLLGKKIYQTYWHQLFGDNYFQNPVNNSKFFIKSTDVNRTIQSCQSHILGIFQNLPSLKLTQQQSKFASPLWTGVKATQGDVFTNSPTFHPFAIHVQKEGSAFNNQGDILRTYSPTNCPRQNDWQAQNHQDRFVKQIFNNQNFTGALNALSNILGVNVSTFDSQSKFYDNYMTTKYLNKQFLPIFQQQQYKRDLAYMYTLSMYINLYYNQLQIKTTSYPFFRDTLANMKSAIKDRDVQWIIYSAHDTTVGNMLVGLNFTNVQCIYKAYKQGDQINKETCVSDYPGYTANIIFQLYQDSQTLQHTIKIRYLGQYRKIPFCNYNYECTLQQFQQYYQSNIKIDSYYKNCHLFDDDSTIYKTAAILQFGIILVFLIAFVLRILKKKDNQPINNVPSRQNLQKSLLSQNLN